MLQRGTSASSVAASKIKQQLRIETAKQTDNKGIRWVDNFSELYTLGDELMPSAHRDMEVRRATRRGGGEELVIKVRSKKGSFNGKSEELSWRQNTELMLNMPQCSSIARLHEVLEDHVAYYVVMEKVGGMDLFETLHQDGKLSLQEVKDVLRQLVTAVNKLHSNGCIHKDLKLENIMLEKTPREAVPPQAAEPPYVAAASPQRRRSLVPAQPAQAAEPPYAAAASPQRRRSLVPAQPAQGRRRSTGTDPSCPTTPGTVKLIDFDTIEEWTPRTPKAVDVLGTDQYIAPEAYDGRYSPASDVFAVGVIAYKLLTGVFPFRGAIFDDKPGENWVGSPKMKEIKGKLEDQRLDWRHPVFTNNPGAQHLIARMLAVDENRRPSAKEVLADPWLSSQPSQPVCRRHSVSTGWLPQQPIDEN